MIGFSPVSRKGPLALTLAGALALMLAVAPAAAQDSRFIGVAMFGEYVPRGEGEEDALGDFDSEFNFSTGQICYYLDIEGVRDPRGLAIHQARHGQNGERVLQLELPGPDGDEVCVGADPAVMRRIADNRRDYYIVVTSVGKPDGAIRGQLEQ